MAGRRAAVAVATAAVAIGTTSGVLVFGGGSSNERASSAGLSDGGLAVLDNEATSADTLPQSVRKAGVTTDLVASTARLAQTVGKSHLYVVRGKQTGVVCLVVTSSDETMINCGRRSQFRNGALYLIRLRPSGLMDIYGVVGNGVKRVNQTGVLNNAFAFTTERRETITLITTKQSRVFSLG